MLRKTTKKDPRKMQSSMDGRAREEMYINVVAIGDESMHGMNMSTTVEKPETESCYLIPLQLPRDIA